MTDIVERLLDRCDRKFINALCEDAATEIRQLRVMFIMRGNAADSMIKELRADNERLTRLLDAFHNGSDIYAEVERLRGENALTNAALECYSDEQRRLTAEIERLRALLRRHQVCAWCELDSDLAVETRAALEPKP